MTKIAGNFDVSYSADGVSLGDYAEDMSPDGARALARDLLDAAAAVELIHDANRRRCEREGHDLHGYDTRRDNRPVHREYCQRGGCDYEHVSDGWRRDYPAKTHYRPIGFHAEPVECTGPDCLDCDAEQLGAAISAAFAPLIRDIDRMITTEETT